MLTQHSSNTASTKPFAFGQHSSIQHCIHPTMHNSISTQHWNHPNIASTTTLDSSQHWLFFYTAYNYVAPRLIITSTKHFINPNIAFIQNCIHPANTASTPILEPTNTSYMPMPSNMHSSNTAYPLNTASIQYTGYIHPTLYLRQHWIHTTQHPPNTTFAQHYSHPSLLASKHCTSTLSWLLLPTYYIQLVQDFFRPLWAPGQSSHLQFFPLLFVFKVLVGFGLPCFLFPSVHVGTFLQVYHCLSCLHDQLSHIKHCTLKHWIPTNILSTITLHTP